MKKIIFLSLIATLLALSSCDVLKNDDDDSKVVDVSYENITTAVTWDKGTYNIEGTISISEGGHLTIQPGTIIKFKDGAGIEVEGANSAITAVGTSSERILFTSFSDNPSTGDWSRIIIKSTSTGVSEFKYCTIEYGGGYSSSYGGSLWLYGSHASVENSIIQKSANYGVYADSHGYFDSFINNNLLDNTLYDIYIYADRAGSIGENNSIDGLGILVYASTISSNDATWKLQTAPYTIDGDVYIESESGAKLTIAAGNTIQFTNNSSISVGSDGFGALVAEGTEDAPILFTSNSTNKQPGQWDYIKFDASALSSSTLNHCIIECAGGYASYKGSVDVYDSKVNIKNTEIRLSDTYGITLNSEGSFATFSGNNIHDCNSYPIFIYANHVSTIGDNNTYSSNSAKGILIYDDDVTESCTWKKQSTPYVIDGDVYVESTSGTTLTIDAGTTVLFTKNSSLIIGKNNFGKLVANGTATNPIKFSTSAPSGGEQPGQWDGIFFYASTMNGSVLNYCELSYGGGYSSSYNNGNINLSDVPSGEPTISNCTISHSAGWGIYNDNSSPTLSNNTFVSNANGDIGN